MTTEHANRNVAFALLVEAGLGVVSLVIGWLAGHQSAVGMSFDTPVCDQLIGIAWGVVATMPMLLVLAASTRVRIPSLDRVEQLAREAVRKLFPKPRLWQLAAVSIAAGLGEELLFRGLVQAGLAALIGGDYGIWIALGIGAAVFGAFHWLNATYALLAMLAGLYFGWLLIASGSLWTPIVAHAAYDFVALVYLVKTNDPIG